jgi:hypothetical protein
MVFVKRGIVVPSGTRCCRRHLYNNHLTYDALRLITPTKVDTISFDGNSVIELVTDCCTSIQNMKTFDFDDPSSLNKESYHIMTGLKRGISC